MPSGQFIGIGVAVCAVLLIVLGGGNSGTFPNTNEHDINSPRTDFLSRRFPPSGTFPTASGPQSTPFHVYAADFFAVWADVDLAAAKKWTANTNFVPVVTTKGRGVGSFWIYHYRDTTAGAYDEVVFLLSVVAKSVAAANGHANSYVVSDSPMEWVERLMFDGFSQSYVPKLWLSQQIPVDWGRDIAGTNKVLADVKVAMDGGVSGTCECTIKEKGSGKPILSVKINPVSTFEALSGVVSMMSQFSFSHLMEASTASTVTFPVALTRGIVTPKAHRDQKIEPESTILMRNSPQPVLQFCDPSNTQFSLSGEGLSDLDFRPRLVQRNSPGRFILFPPHNIATN